MEENQSAKNIRIAKNTFFLYLRMFLMMGISLYTSRIVLSTLGEVDYGLYNVVGGIVTMFTFVNFAMTCATNRYLSFELGKNNGCYIRLYTSPVVITFVYKKTLPSRL